MLDVLRVASDLMKKLSCHVFFFIGLYVVTVKSDQRLRMDIVAVASDQLNDLGFMSSRQQHNYHAPRLLGKVVLSGVPAASAAVIFALAAICTLAGRATHQTD